MGNTATAKNFASTAALTIEQRLALLEQENAALKAQVAMAPAVGEFRMGITEARKPGTNGEKDKGSKGGSLALSLGNQHVYPSVGMVNAIVEHADEIREFILKNKGKLTR